MKIAFPQKVPAETKLAGKLDPSAKLDSSSVPPQIISALVEVAALVQVDAAGPLAKQLIGKIAEATGLSPIGLDEDIRTIRRIKRLTESDEAAMHVANIVLTEHFHVGCYLWHEPDGKLWEFDGRRWTETSKTRLKQVVTETCLASPNLVALAKPKVVKAAVDTILTVSLRSSYLANIAATPSGFLINVSNCELWLHGSIISARPQRPWTAQTVYVDIEHDPTATCPMFDDAIKEIFSKSKDAAGMVRHWLEFAGFAVQPRRKIASFWLLIGKGANGKSRLLSILQKLIGPEGVLAEPISRFQNDRFALSSLEGKRVLIDDDVDEDLVLSDGLIKKLSEEKVVTARAPYGRSKRTMLSIALPIMAGNHYPTTSDVSPGMRRRTFVMPYNRTFEPAEQKADLFEMIWRDEKSGILNSVLDGFLRVVARNYHFHEPSDCIIAREVFFTESNPLRAFLSERCESSAGAKTRQAYVRDAFKSWARENSVPISSLGGHRLKRHIELLGYDVIKSNGYPTVQGLLIKNENKA